MDHLMRSKQPEAMNLISCLVRCWLQSNVEAVGETKLDLRKNEKKATVNNAQVKAWDVRFKSKSLRMENRIAGVMGCF